MNKTTFSLLAALAIAAGSAGAGDDNVSEKSYSRSEIDSLLNFPQSDQREKGVKAILNATDFDTTWAFETIMEGLQIEEDYLENSRVIPQGYVWISWWNVQNYVRDLALLGSESIESLTEFGRTLPADQKKWVTIAIGYQKNEEVHDELRKIIAESDDILQKAMAIEAISQYQDSTDFPILIQAKMEDDNAIIWATNSDIVGIDPVGMASDKAFWDMGFILEWDGEKYVLKKLEDVKINNPKTDPGADHE
jgi:hypothetical protein